MKIISPTCISLPSFPYQSESLFGLESGLLGSCRIFLSSSCFIFYVIQAFQFWLLSLDIVISDTPPTMKVCPFHLFFYLLFLCSFSCSPSVSKTLLHYLFSFVLLGEFPLCPLPAPFKESVGEITH